MTTNILVVGLYYGKNKPDVNCYFKPLCNELQNIHKENGFQMNGERFMPMITQCNLDLPAKCMVQGTIQYNGYH